MRILILTTICVVLSWVPTTLSAQTLHIDPPSLVVMSAEQPITIDGRLDETDWQRRIFHVNFRANYKPDDGSYAVTGSVMPPEFDSNGTGNDGYSDSSSAQVFFLHYGTDLYIGVRSTDSSVCKRFPSWEADGLFMKVKTKAGADVEFKLMYFNGAEGASAVYETSGNAPAGAGDGMSYEFPGTITNKDTTKSDSGYSFEMVIHLDKMGYGLNDVVTLNGTVFDLDFYTPVTATTPNPRLCDFYKSWWGSEWGGPTDASYRNLILGDKPVADAYATTSTITLDGRLDESTWANAPSIELAPGSKDATNWWYMQWGDSLASFDDRSLTTVKFLHNGTDLYIGFVSNDSSVCNWSTGWEADGMFIWMRDKFTIPGPGSRQEVKLMFFGDSVGGPAKFEVNGNVPTGGAEGVAYAFPGTVTRTESNGKDAGYSGEVIIHGDKWGYVDGDTIRIAIDMWDMDRSSVDVTDPYQRIYAKSWWGSEWVDIFFDKYYMYRGIYLSPTSVTAIGDEVAEVPTAFSLSQNFPNPFNPQTAIRYELADRGHVTITVHNLLGEEVAKLVDAVQGAGSYEITWDGRSSSGIVVTSGVYFYRLQAGSSISVRKMVLLK